MPGALVSDLEVTDAGEVVLPWWFNRNDTRLGVRTGPRALSVTDYVTYTDDRQEHYGRSHHDTYRRYSRTIRSGQIVH
jgi:hypothetical protein